MKKQVFNPYMPLWEYVPDGEPHVFGDRVYVYGSHDRFDGKLFCLNDYVCWSAPVEDLSDWRCEGVIYRKTQALQGKIPLAMYAPDVTRGPDGRYYLYYCLSFVNNIQVAVCDTPAGQYQFYGLLRHPDGTVYGKKKEDKFCFDPAVLTDDDGRVWLYSGFQGLPYGSNSLRQNQCLELEADMLTVKSARDLIPCPKTSKGTGFEGHEFFEASSIRKFGGKYYFIYSSILSHELAYAVSDRPDGGFVYGGTLHSNCNIGIDGNESPLCYWGNNHGSVEKIGEKYYIFGHRQTNYHEFSRQAVAEEIRFEDGRFFPAEMTSCGLNGGPLRDTGEYPAVIACMLMGRNGACKITKTGNRALHPTFTQEKPDGETDSGNYIKNISHGTLVGYKYFGFTAPRQLTLTLRGKGDGIITLSHEPEGTPIGTLRVGSRSGWTKVSCPITPEAGTKALYLRYYGLGSFDLRSLAFE